MHVAARAHLRRTPGRARKDVPDRNEGVDFAVIVELSWASPGGGRKKIGTSVLWVCVPKSKVL